MKFLIHTFIFLLFLFLAIYSALAFYVIKNAEKDEKKRADVILVLGSKSYLKYLLNPCLVARVTHAVSLYKAGYAPKLLFSGGTDKDDGKNEAQTMKKIALSLGVPAKDILLESASTTTYENILFSEKILKAENLKSIILVTEPFHSPRAMLVVKKFGLNAVNSPATDSLCWTNNKYFSYYFLKEPLAIFVYKIENKL